MPDEPVRYAMNPDGYWFRSSLFLPECGEDRETNPGVFGRQLACWLADRLRDRGYQVTAPLPEDWGWYVRCSWEGGPSLLVGCGNVMDQEDEATAGVGAEAGKPEALVWHCFAALHRPILARLLHRSRAEGALASLDAALAESLAGEPAITREEAT